MDKNLYQHLHCRFIAHYSIHGFKEVYNGYGFLDFIVHFRRDPWIKGHADYHDINGAMIQVVLEHEKAICFEYDNKHIQDELQVMKRLASKHGYNVISLLEDTLNENTTIGEDGQLSLIQVNNTK